MEFHLMPKSLTDHSRSERRVLRLLQYVIALSVLQRVHCGLTEIHKEGYCSMYDSCGSNQNGRLACPDNRPAETIDEALAAKIAEYCPYLWNEISDRRTACCTSFTITEARKSMERALRFISGCPACANNFENLWCTITCHPDQSLFIDVMETQLDEETKNTTVKKANLYFAREFKETLFDSCKDVIYSPLNRRFLSFMGDPSTADDFLEFLGTSLEEGGNAPYSLKFKNETEVPDGMSSREKEIPQCGSVGFECSCADCPPADYCQTPVSRESHSERSEFLGLRTYEWGILAGGLIALVVVYLFLYQFNVDKYMYYVDSDEMDSANSSEILSDGNETASVSRRRHLVEYSAVEQLLRDRFYALGSIVARYPYLTICISLLLVVILSLGNMGYELEKTGQGLWTPKGSRTAKNKDKYEESFGAFYRVTNVVYYTTPDSESTNTSADGLPSIVNSKSMDLMFDVQELIDGIEGHFEKDGKEYSVKLKDICYKPMGICVIESVLQYWQMERSNWDQMVEFIPKGMHDEGVRFFADMCFTQWTTNCRSNFESPIDPRVVLGGFPVDDSFRSFVDDSTAFSVSYLLDSSKENRDAVLAWEKAFTDTAKTKITDMIEAAKLKVAFMTDGSTDDELERETYMDSTTVAISYAVMFIYITAALTFFIRTHDRSSANILVRSRAMVAFCGVGIVVLSVLGAFGIISYFNIKISMIVLEVLPFLVLAVGVDNMFIMANEFTNLDISVALEVRLANTLTEVGPSIACAATAETLAFGLAAISPVPAARNFSICACFAILIDFLLQITAFAAILVLDAKKRESDRVDCFPWVKIKDEDPGEDPEYVVKDRGTPDQEKSEPIPKTLLQRFISKKYVPFLLGENTKVVRWLVLSIAVTLFTASCVLLGRMEKGMAEQVAFPRDSFLQEYFTDGLPRMRVGAPVMFVAENLNVSLSSDDVSKVCGIGGCRPDSLVSQLDLAARAGAVHLATPAASWVDDFQMWIRSPTCCRKRSEEDFCDYSEEDPDCKPCSLFVTQEVNVFQEYLPVFMGMAPDEICPRGGVGAFQDLIQHAPGNPTDVTGLSEGVIKASAFRSNYVRLTDQNDYIEALEETHDFVDQLSDALGIHIYSYSVFHVFFQQYLNLEPVAVMMLSVAIVSVFVVCWIMLSSFRAAVIVMVCVVLTVVDLVGANFLSEIKLNGVSVVNLTMSVGIAVEFCVHLVHSFMVLPGSRYERVKSALEEIGLSVITGIAMTKFLGVIVLGWSQTDLFQIYYFRMYLSLVGLCVFHGLVVLPILLGIFGPGPPSALPINSEREPLVVD